MSEQNGRSDETQQRHNDRSVFPLTRRGILAAGAVGLGLAGASGAAGAQQGGGDGNTPFADEEHDHSGENGGRNQLGVAAPVESIRSESITADLINTTLYADSIAELKAHIETITDTENNDEPMGAKIVLPRGKLEADADQLPIKLISGVVIEGQGEYATKIDASGIGKPVFKLDKAHETPLGRRVVLRDFMVGGAEPTDGFWGHQEPGSIGVYLDNVHGWQIERCHFRNLEDGIVANGSWNGIIKDCICKFNGQDGIRAFPNSQDYKTNLLRIVNSQCSNNGRYGINAKKLKELWIAGMSIEQNRKYGIKTDGVRTLDIDGSYIEGNALDLDRTGDGTENPVEVALSPGADDDPTRGVTIQGCYIVPFPRSDWGGVGIKIGNARDVEIANNTFRTIKDPSNGVELSQRMRDVRIRSSNNLETTSMVRGPLNEARIPPNELNDGVWKTSQFKDLETMETLASDYVGNNLRNSLEIVLSEDVSGSDRPINGWNFPPGTVFRGLGRTQTTVESTGSKASDFAILLSRERQKAENLTVKTSGGIGVAMTGEETAVEELYVPESGPVGIRIFDGAVRSSVRDVVCTDAKVDVQGERARVNGCDANIDTSEVSEVALAGNIDRE